MNLKSGEPKINKDWIFTCNQGTSIGAVVELYKITPEPVYLNDAIKSANYTLDSLTRRGLLKSEGSGSRAASLRKDFGAHAWADSAINSGKIIPTDGIHKTPR